MLKLLLHYTYKPSYLKKAGLSLMAIFFLFYGCSAQTGPKETATFAGGCFWCVEAMLERVEGVEKVVSGYAGGVIENPTYEQVSRGETNYAEAVQVTYNTSLISYPELLEMFFYTHDPTQLDKQEPDHGPQYRSAIFYHNDNPKQLAYDHIKMLETNGKRGRPIMTEMNPLDKFYEAEAYHQDFVEKNPQQGYVVSVALPKIKKFTDKYRSELKPEYQ